MRENFKDNLQFMEQVALEGEIAFYLCTSPHDEEMLYRIFMLIEKAPSYALDYLINEIKEQVSLPEELIDTVILQAINHEVPVWIWLDRTIADIKQLVSGIDSFSSPFKLSVNKKEARQKVLISSFCIFIKKLCYINSLAATTLLNHVLNNEDVEFLHTACFMLKDFIELLNGDRPPKKIIGRDILDISFDPKESLNFSKMFALRENPKPLEEEENLKLDLDNLEFTENESILTSRKQFEGISKILESIVEQLSDKSSSSIEVVIDSGEKYVVVKNQDGYKALLKIFDTKEEAQEYINDIKEKAPDLKAEFEIRKLENGNLK